jgi:hypothetical protein
MNTNTPVEHAAEVNESEISMVAYQKWEKAGRPIGKDLRFWLEAEAQLRAPAVAARAIVTAHLPPVMSEKSTPKAGTGQLGSNQPNVPRPGQKFRRP